MKKVLIVDDDKIITTLLKTKLQERGVIVKVAENGSEGLELVKSFSPSLILSDIMMPHMSGLEFIRIIKKDLKDTTPIIVVSVLDDEEVVTNALKIGADDFVSKPINVVELMIRVNKFLNLTE